MTMTQPSVLTPQAGAAPQPAAPPWPFRRILVAVDHPLHPAVRIGIELARMASASLYLVTVVEHRGAVPYGDTFAFGYYEDPYEPVREEAAKLLKKCKEDVPANVTVECLLREGTAPFEIADAAREVAADLVVLGTHRRGGIKRLFLGSTSAGVIPKVECPVLLVTDREEPAAERKGEQP